MGYEQNQKTLTGTNEGLAALRPFFEMGQTLVVQSCRTGTVLYNWTSAPRTVNLFFPPPTLRARQHLDTLAKL